MIGRLILGLIPWWLYAILAIGHLSVSTAVVGDHLSLRDEAGRALALPPPQDQLADLSHIPGADRPLGELRLRGVIVETGSFRWGKSSRAWALIGAPDGTGQRIALIMSEQELADLTGRAAQSRDQTVEVSGFLDRSGANLLRVADSLMARGLMRDIPAASADYWHGSREEAIAGKLRGSLIAALIPAALTLVAAMAALLKFRAWRLRRGAASAARTVRAGGQAPWGQPAGGMPVRGAAKPLRQGEQSLTSSRKDRFAASPIQSSRPGGVLRWFSR